jgi:hypothetical protein
VASKGIVTNRQHINFVLSGARREEKNGHAEDAGDGVAVSSDQRTEEGQS